MKFFTLVATLITVTTSVLGQYCGNKCDPSKTPNGVFSAPLEIVTKVDKNNPSILYEIGGTVTIKDDCHFTVENFYMFPGSASAKWMGAKIGSGEGINLSTESEIPAIDPNQPQTMTYDVSSVNVFCPVSLLNDVGRIQLLDSNYQLLAYADVNPAITVDGSSNNAGSPAGSTARGKSVKETDDAQTIKWSMALFLSLTTIVAIFVA